MPVPDRPKIYHIVHVDRLASIIASGRLWSDVEMERRGIGGTTIGMSEIKDRRRNNALSSHPGLQVGECVPFYFCPRSVMLYVIKMADHPGLTYRGGQGRIIHLESDLYEAVALADANERRWVFTTSNAGSSYFEDFSDLEQLEGIDWDAVQANNWSAQSVKENKQAEFLTEHEFPWELISRIGTISSSIRDQVLQILEDSTHLPRVEVQEDWYY